ncbi:MAG: PEP-CTERM sorting domain-containing protein [Verrucomicrobiales bacterium]|nr:PEP-CTERM sorting domain-containing protein [Verrucomicrobiales bacterium]MCP5557236.1 PEP-CTERM sorting domain-containing protein [Verrucomicrobiaceae bacterium]
MCRSILLTTFFAVSSLRAAVTLVGGAPQVASDDSVTGHTTFSGITVQAGDYVVVATASNKSTTANELTYHWTGTEGTSGNSTSLTSEQTFAAYLSYTAITVGGTYDFQVLATVSNLTANSALYVLRPGSGEMIVVADTDATANATGSASQLSYVFGTSLPSGIAIEAATTQSGGAFTLDSNYTTPNASAAGSGRLISYSTSVSGGTWSSNSPFTNTPDDIASVGAVFGVASVPEPSRGVLLVGALGFLVWRRRRA